MINKTRTGISFFDEMIGGAYRKRPLLCCGRQGSGKTLFALHCLKQAVEEGEQVLLLSSWNPRDLSIVADKVLGFSFDDAVEAGVVTLLEYAGIMASPVFEKDVTLPPDSFLELTELIEEKAVKRVILDTVLPWVAIRQKERLAKHVFSFVQAFDRMGVTAFFTLPRPASPLAFMLKNQIEDLVPVSLVLDVDSGGQRSLAVNKYLGEPIMPPPKMFTITPGVGIVAEGKRVAAGDTVASRPEKRVPAKPNAPIRFAAAFKNT